MNLIHTIIKIFISVSNNYDMWSLIILKNVLLLFVSSTTTYPNLALGPLLYYFLCLTLRTNNLTYIVCLLIIHCRLSQINLLIFFKWLVIIWRNKCGSHFHAIFNQTNSLSMQLISLTNFICIYPTAIFIVDWLRTWRFYIRIIWSEFIYFGCQFI